MPVHPYRKEFQPNDRNFLQAVDDATADFGGVFFHLPPGILTVFRDPYQRCLAVFPEFHAKSISSEGIRAEEETYEDVGHVIVDTRRIGIADISLCYKARLIQECREARKLGDSKSSRDLLRNAGASVRYGFDKRPGETLDVRFDKSKDTLVIFGRQNNQERFEETVDGNRAEESTYDDADTSEINEESISN